MDIDEIKKISNINQLLEIYDCYSDYSNSKLKKLVKGDTTKVKQYIEDQKECAKHILEMCQITKDFLVNLEKLINKDIELYDVQIEYIDTYKDLKKKFN
jgi:hypothetical protein